MQALAEAELGACGFEGLLRPCAPREGTLEEGLVRLIAGEERRGTLESRRAGAAAVRKPRERALGGLAVTAPHIGLGEVGCPCGRRGARLGVPRAELGNPLEAVDGGVDSVKSELEESDGLAGHGLDRRAHAATAEIGRLGGVAAAVMRPAQAGLDAGQPDEARHGFLIEAGRLGRAKRLESGCMGGRPVAQPVLELCELRECRGHRPTGFPDGERGRGVWTFARHGPRMRLRGYSALACGKQPLSAWRSLRGRCQELPWPAAPR
jgi:hypothetical protein